MLNSRVFKIFQGYLKSKFMIILKTDVLLTTIFTVSTTISANNNIVLLFAVCLPTAFRLILVMTDGPIIILIVNLVFCLFNFVLLC